MNIENLFRYKLLIFISMLFIACIIAADIFTYKIIFIFKYEGSASLIVFPMIFLLSDMITELYGKKISRFFLYCGIAVEFIFDCIFSKIVYLTSPSTFHLQAAFTNVIGTLPRIFVGVFIALFVSSLINIFLMSYWKEKLLKKSYSLRSLFSSLTGELVFVIIGYMIWFYGVKPIPEIIQLMIVSFVTKILFTLILVWPISSSVYLIKKRYPTLF